MKRVLRRNHVILLVLFMLLACSMNMVAKDGVLYRGMPKDLVIEAIGKPSATSLIKMKRCGLILKVLCRRSMIR